jgi:hypothetical protein
VRWAGHDVLNASETIELSFTSQTTEKVIHTHHPLAKLVSITTLGETPIESKFGHTLSGAPAPRTGVADM